MNAVTKNILAVVAGIIVGGFVNMGIIAVSGSIVAPPEGVDMTTPEGLAAGIELLEPKHFLMPFLAHALGAFFGALTTGLIAASHKMRFALIIGAFYLVGGIMMVFMVPAPIWFVAVDLILAYLPMAFIAGKIASRKQ